MVIRHAGGPGGGSLPAWVMRAGEIAPMSPYDARRDITQQNVGRVTRMPVGLPPGIAQDSLPPPPPSTDAFGAPVLAFDVPAQAGPELAVRYGDQLRQMASAARRAGFSLPAAVVGTPLEALTRGHTVVLRFANGSQVSVVP